VVAVGRQRKGVKRVSRGAQGWEDLEPDQSIAACRPRGPQSERDQGSRRESRHTPRDHFAAADSRAGAHRRYGCARRLSRVAQRKNEIARRLKSRSGILLQAVRDHLLDRRRHLRTGRRELRRLVPENRVHRLDGRIAAEGPLAAEHLVEDDAEAEDVRAMVDGEPTYLFRRHVADCTEHLARVGLELDAAGRKVGRDNRALGQAEIQNLHTPVRCHDHVFGLDIAMDDPALVSRGESLGDLSAVFQRATRGDRALHQHRPQRVARDQFHDGEAKAAVLADIEDREDVRVRKRGHGTGLAFEPRERHRIVGDLGGQHLDRDLAAETRIACAIHLAHAARAEQRDNVVRAEACSSQ